MTLLPGHNSKALVYKHALERGFRHSNLYTELGPETYLQIAAVTVKLVDVLTDTRVSQ